MSSQESSSTHPCNLFQLHSITHLSSFQTNPPSTAFLYAVEILPLQYRSQVQSTSNTVYWFLAFIAVYFGGQGAADPGVGAKVYITFCITGAIVTVLAWIYVVESKSARNIGAPYWAISSTSLS